MISVVIPVIPVNRVTRVPVFTKKTRITGKTTKYRKDHKTLFNRMYFRVFPLVLIFSEYFEGKNVYRVDRSRNFSKSKLFRFRNLCLV